MWLLRYLQLSKSRLKQGVRASMLWRYSWQLLIVSYLVFFCVLMILVFAGAFGLLNWQERQYLRTEVRLAEQIRQINTDVRSLIGQGNWLGVTVMPALAAKLPVPDLRTQLTDLEYFHQLAKRFHLTEPRIHPRRKDSAGESGGGSDQFQDVALWRNYEMRFRSEARDWLAVINHLALLPGVRLQEQVWSNEGDAVLQLGVAGRLPVPVVGQVGDREGANRLILRNGRLQRVFHDTERSGANES